jgi:hypothetical protein
VLDSSTQRIQDAQHDLRGVLSCSIATLTAHWTPRAIRGLALATLMDTLGRGFSAEGSYAILRIVPLELAALQLVIRPRRSRRTDGFLDNSGDIC